MYRLFLIFSIILGCESSVEVTLKNSDDKAESKLNTPVVVIPSFSDGNFGNNSELGPNGIQIKEWSSSERQITSSHPIFGSSLAALWHLEDNTVLSIDSSGGGFDLTPNGTVSDIAGKLGNGLSLTGAGNLSVNSLIGSPSNATLSAWVYHISRDTSGSEVLSLGDSIFLRANRSGTSDRAVSAIYNGGGYDLYDSSHQFDLVDGWNHMVFVFDDTNDLYSLYVNSVAVETGSNLGSINYSLGTNTVIGAHADGSSNFDITGYIDEVSIWSKALSKSEVELLYQRQNGSFGGGEESVFESDLYDNGISKTWNNLLVTPYAPYKKPIPDLTETNYTSENLDTSNLVALWHLDETSIISNGQNILESGPFGYTTTLNDSNLSNISPQNGNFNGSLSFDGVDDYFSSNFNFQPALNEAFTFVAWFNSSNVPVSSNDFNSLISVNHGTTDIALLGVGNRNSGGATVTMDSAFFYFREGGLTDNVNTEEKSVKLFDGKWHLIIGGRETDGTLFISVDGKNKITGVQRPQALSGGDFLSLGGNSNAGGTAFLNGFLDEVSVWNKALTNSEILQLYKRGISNAKFKVRVCDENPCTGSFIGPDGTNSSWFDEQANSSNSLPEYDLTPLALTGRYFQYQILLETENSLYTPIIEGVDPE